MKINQCLFALFMFGSLLFTMTSCGDDESVVTPLEEMTIAEIVQDNAEFSSLLAALEKTQLTSVLNGTDPYTVFAPQNDAFAAFLSDKGFANLDAVPTDVLTQILLNHVIAGDVKSTDLSTGYFSNLAAESTTGNNIFKYIDVSNGVTINGVNNVITADVSASNGTIHIIDSVIDLPTIVTFAVTNPDLSILVQALTRPSFGSTYVDILSSTEAPFTVFAPTNQAFVNLLGLLGVDSLDDIDDETLQNVLNYHVIAGANVLAGSLEDEQKAMTFQGSEITIDLDNGAQIKEGAGGPSNIIATDIQSFNGVVHVIDTVLLPM